MDAELGLNRGMTEQDRSLSAAFLRERSRLRGFIRRRVADPADAEDILQEVFYELVQAERLLRPVEQVGAWLFRVARNRITDLFRKRRHEQIASRADEAAAADEPAEAALQDLLPSPDAGPDAQYARRLLLEELDDALDELPEEQRSVFIAHELEGRSFKELADESGVSLNTLLSRKRYAVLHLRRRLQAIHDEFL
jgi:RNA polymerase sigma factor (sigma-70 family)